MLGYGFVQRIRISDVAYEMSKITKRGQWYYISDMQMTRIENHPLMNEGWTKADCILGHIAGSAYDWSYHVNPTTKGTMFMLRTKPTTDGLRTWVSPDRKDLFRKRPDGLYELLETITQRRKEHAEGRAVDNGKRSGEATPGKPTDDHKVGTPSRSSQQERRLEDHDSR